MQQNRIKDNFLPDDMFRRLTDFVDGKVPCRPNVDWFYNDTSVSYGDGCPQFTNMSYVNGKPLSNVYDVIDSLVFPTLRPLAVLRVKLNMTPRAVVQKRTPLHIDITGQPDESGGYKYIPDYKVCILYLNDGDGYTYFEDGSTIETKANRAVLFDGDRYHGGAASTNANVRTVLNINYIPSLLSP
jgi:hypothetical protein|tara:strand:+ start:526 stop:1080 length:555 start_codon:yes stop_codon:yes gene_type:complete